METNLPTNHEVKTDYEVPVLVQAPRSNRRGSILRREALEGLKLRNAKHLPHRGTSELQEKEENLQDSRGDEGRVYLSDCCSARKQLQFFGDFNLISNK